MRAKALPKAEPLLNGDWLAHIMELQEEYQRFMYGVNPKDLPLDAKIAALHTMFTALVCEAVETMDEVGWKPWATKKFINTEKAQGEVIDQLHFVMNQALLLGMTPTMVYEKYVEKQERNRERQRVGYSGVDEKCIRCKRDIRDVQAATGLPPVGVADTKTWYCGECTKEWTKPE